MVLFWKRTRFVILFYEKNILSNNFGWIIKYGRWIYYIHRLVKFIKSICKLIGLVNYKNKIYINVVSLHTPHTCWFHLSYDLSQRCSKGRMCVLVFIGGKCACLYMNIRVYVVFWKKKTTTSLCGPCQGFNQYKLWAHFTNWVMVW
jgi:hypothetical protein